VTRSITPEISSVAGLRSGIAAFMCGVIFPRAGGIQGISQNADSTAIFC
jgi:hypothetical protein